MYSVTLMRLSLVLFFGYWCGTVDGFASGAPRQACSYMTPSHYTSPQTGPSYMTVTIEDGVTSYEAGDEITGKDIVLCKAKRQYLLTLQVSIYCLLALFSGLFRAFQQHKPFKQYCALCSASACLQLFTRWGLS